MSNAQVGSIVKINNESYIKAKNLPGRSKNAIYYDINWLNSNKFSKQEKMSIEEINLSISEYSKIEKQNAPKEQEDITVRHYLDRHPANVLELAKYDFKNELYSWLPMIMEGYDDLKKVNSLICTLQYFAHEELNNYQKIKKYEYFKSEDYLKFECDGNGRQCELTAHIYDLLWNWNENPSSGDVMNNAHSIILKWSKSKLEKKKVSAKILYKDIKKINSDKDMRNQLEIEDLELYEALIKNISLNHTIGNFCLLPSIVYLEIKKENLNAEYKAKHINNTKNNSCSDQMLFFLQYILSKGNNDFWLKDDCIRKYINTMFLWDYVTVTNDGRYDVDLKGKTFCEIISSGGILYNYLNNINNNILRRGIFMVTMLLINQKNPKFYQCLQSNVFNQDVIYNGYDHIFERIKECLVNCQKNDCNDSISTYLSDCVKEMNKNTNSNFKNIFVKNK